MKPLRLIIESIHDNQYSIEDALSEWEKHKENLRQEKESHGIYRGQPYYVKLQPHKSELALGASFHASKTIYGDVDNHITMILHPKNLDHPETPGAFVHEFRHFQRFLNRKDHHGEDYALTAHEKIHDFYTRKPSRFKAVNWLRDKFPKSKIRLRNYYNHPEEIDAFAHQGQYEMSMGMSGSKELDDIQKHTDLHRRGLLNKHLKLGLDTYKNKVKNS